jgi:hypothetical protein
MTGRPPIHVNALTARCNIREHRGKPLLVIPMPGDRTPGSGVPTQTNVCGMP